MRQEFTKELYLQMLNNDKIWLLTGDLGFGLFDEIRDEFPDRFLNTGAAEQAMMDIAVGLALSGKIPFVYSITPFLIYRPFETIRTYIDHEQIPVHLVGSGRDQDYTHDGFSHNAGDVKGFLDRFAIAQYWPDDKKKIPLMVEKIVLRNRPSFLSLKR